MSGKPNRRRALPRALGVLVLSVILTAFVATTAFVALAAPAGPQPPAAGPLPDLEQELPSDLRLRATGPKTKPSYRLGFRSAVRNVGEGPFIVSGHRESWSSTMTAHQVIEHADGSRVVVPGIGALRYVSSPDHSHWHYLGFDHYELRPAGTSRAVVRDRKTGFCLGDRYRATAVRTIDTVRRPVYTGRCGLGDTGLLEIEEGISVGFGDDYNAFLEYQDLPLDGLPNGQYVLVHRVNADRKIRELSYANNAASVLIDLRWRGGKPFLTVLDSCPGTARCDPKRGLARSSSARPPIARASEPYLPDDTPDGTPGSWSALQWNFTGPYGVNAPLAWANLIADGAPGGAGVTVAVLDTGVAYADSSPYRISPDLGPAQFVEGWDFIDDDAYPIDENGHGTHVASTIAEQTNNAYGLTGLAYGARIMPVRVLNRDGAGDAVTIARGVVYAVDHGAKVINLSLNFDSSVTAGQIPDLLRSFAYAALHGSVVVAAAGNESGGAIPYPARSANVVAVGATTEFGCAASYSNYGPQLDFVAPGGGRDAYLPSDPNCQGGREGRSIYQVTFDGQPEVFGIPGDFFGTSMAAPHVSATAALIVASRTLGPNPTPAQIVARLKGTARDLGRQDFDEHYGWGLVDAAAATAQPAAFRTARGLLHARSAGRGRSKANLVVRVHAPIALRTRPGGPEFERIGAWTAFGSPQTLSVVAEAGRWLRVTSEQLPTGATAWIDGKSTRVTVVRTPLSILVRLRTRTLELRSGDTLLRRFPVGIGAAASPTPTGRFAVTDKLPGSTYGGYYGCCILALTAHQTSLPPGWLGGDRIAIHGTGTPSTIGQAASAGCLRASDANLRALIAAVPLGTPVVISQ